MKLGRVWAQNTLIDGRTRPQDQMIVEIGGRQDHALILTSSIWWNLRIFFKLSKAQL